jgi:hypothetical protein
MAGRSGRCQGRVRPMTIATGKARRGHGSETEIWQDRADLTGTGSDLDRGEQQSWQQDRAGPISSGSPGSAPARACGGSLRARSGRCSRRSASPRASTTSPRGGIYSLLSRSGRRNQVPRGFTWSPGRVRPFPPRRRSAQRGLSFSLQHARNAEYEKEEFAFVSPYFASLRRGSFLPVPQHPRPAHGPLTVLAEIKSDFSLTFRPSIPASWQSRERHTCRQLTKNSSLRQTGRADTRKVCQIQKGFLLIYRFYLLSLSLPAVSWSQGLS